MGKFEVERPANLVIVIELEERWYRQVTIERGNRQFVVADPDGYLLRFYQNLGVRYGNLPVNREIGTASADHIK